MKKQPWYIWFSIPAFGFLFLDTAIRVCFREKKDTTDIMWLRALGNIMGLTIVVIALPMTLVGQLALLVESHFGRDSFFATAVRIILWISLYFLGVYATYRHELWRRKNIPYLLKSKQKTECDD